MIWKLYGWFDRRGQWNLLRPLNFLASSALAGFGCWAFSHGWKIFGIGVVAVSVASSTAPAYYHSSHFRRYLANRAKNSEFLSRWVATYVAVTVALIPVWIWCSVGAWAQPEGFWQKIILGGLALYFLGLIQLLLLVALITILLGVIWD